MASEPWRKTLYALFAAEFVAMTAFSFVGPFMPLYIQELGNFTAKEAAFWSGMASSGVGIGMFLSSSLWGIAADRWGRKVMVLRVMFAGAAVLALQGIAPNIYWFIALKWAQGILTGSAAAVTAMATSVVPREKIPYAAGVITVSVTGGGSLGPIIGGFLADHIGYRNPFFVIGGMLLAAGILVFFLSKEQFEPPQRSEASLGGMFRLSVSKDMLPVLAFLFLGAFVGSLTGPIFTLFIKELNPSGQASTAAGVIFGLSGLVFTISTLAATRLSDRFSLRKILIISAALTTALWVPPAFSGTVLQFFIFMLLLPVPGGGWAVASNAVVGLAVTHGQQGMAYGLANSANSMGGGLGTLAGGWLASIIGFRPMFAITAGLDVLIVAFIIKFLPKRLFPNSKPQPDSVT